MTAGILGRPIEILSVEDNESAARLAREALDEAKVRNRTTRARDGVKALAHLHGAEEDIVESYDLHANCYIREPLDLERVLEVVRSIEDFWLTVVRLPPHGRVY